MDLVYVCLPHVFLLNLCIYLSQYTASLSEGVAVEAGFSLQKNAWVKG